MASRNPLKTQYFIEKDMYLKMSMMFLSIFRNIMMAVAEKDTELLSHLLRERLRHPKFPPATEQRWQHQLHNALQVAVVLQSRDMIAMLLDAGKTLRTTSSLRTHLLTAVDSGNDVIVTLLLQHGADPNARGFDDAPAHVAARNGDVKILELLYKSGADLSILSAHSHSTPLHRAAAKGQTDTVKYLLDKGASLECRNKEGKTPLHLAARSKNSFTVFQLLAHGACKSDQDAEGRAPWRHALANDDVMIMEMLLQDEGPTKVLEIRDAVMLACQGSHLNCLAALLRKPYLAHQSPILDENGCTLLMTAFDRRKVAAVKTVIENAPSSQLAVNARDDDGRCVLVYALLCLDADDDYIYEDESAYDDELIMTLIKQLIKAGADPNLSYRNGAPLIFSDEVMISMERLRFLIECGCNLNVRCHDGETIWHAAVNEKAGTHVTNVHALRQLVNANADIRLTSVEHNGFTPLTKALSLDRFVVAKYLLMVGCSTHGVRDWMKKNPRSKICTDSNLAEFRKQLDLITNKPRSLREISRLEILGSIGQGPDLVTKVGQLGLPKILQSYVISPRWREWFCDFYVRSSWYLFVKNVATFIIVVKYYTIRLHRKQIINNGRSSSLYEIIALAPGRCGNNFKRLLFSSSLYTIMT